MLNESLFLLSLADLKNVLVNDLNIFHVALTYTLVYVVYKALGRYVYFKPQEHSSKINRTFLASSLIIVTLHFFESFINYLPFLAEYRWFYALCSLVLLTAPLSILMHRLVWRYNPLGGKHLRYRDYLPIPKDYYKTALSKSETFERSGSASYSQTWEEEGVESTREHFHSDALLNSVALIVLIISSAEWAYESFANYGWYSIIYFQIITMWLAMVYIDRSVFSWMQYSEDKWERYKRRPKKH